jgi:trk system potassium uptake protein TrkH
MAVYAILGMPAFDAVVHGMATIATGGFSSRDDSFTSYSASLQYAAALFMFLASLPYIRFVQLMNGSAIPLWQDAQVRAYAKWLGMAVVSVAVWRIWTTNIGVESAFRESLFNLTSIMSSTGFGTLEFSGWGGFMLVVAFVLGVVGACSGSSAAGLSVFRVQLVIAVLRREVRRIGNPSTVDPIRYEGRTVEEDVLNALILFVSSFILILGTMSVTLTLMGVDTESALFAVWTTLGNVGYGFGPLVEEHGGTFSGYPPGAIAVMSLCMILGRLGLLAILVMVLPNFWRR